MGSILFWLMPHSGPPQLTMAFLKYIDATLSSFLQTHLPFRAVGRRLSLQLLLRKPGGPRSPNSPWDLALLSNYLKVGFPQQYYTRSWL